MSKNKLYADRANRLIPGGAHTYSKGRDQFPGNAPQVIARGNGCKVWDADGNEYLDMGMSLGSVILGHAYEPVLQAVRNQLINGSNFVRPAVIEGELAELMTSIIPCAEMVKFSKHGSDATTAAVKLARAYTGRDYVIRCQSDPFNSIHDWFIGSTVMSNGIPDRVKELTLTFKYNDLNSLTDLFDKYPNQIACVLFEPLSFEAPEDDFIAQVKTICEENGAILIFDEVVSGFRFSLGGAQEKLGVTPHLAAFGKAMANGFSVSALCGNKEIMSLGGIEHSEERVFLMSTTHGGETHSLAAAIATINEISNKNLINHFWHAGERIQNGINEVVKQNNFSNKIEMTGYGCKPAISFKSTTQQAAIERTIFMQELVKLNVLIPYIVPCYAHTDEIIDDLIAKVSVVIERMAIAHKAGDLNAMLDSETVKPVFRKFN